MKIFVSYTLRDHVLSRSALRALETVLWRYGTPYIDLLHNPGNDPQQHVIRMLSEASVMIALITPGYRESEWVDLELEFARKLEVPILSLSATTDFTNFDFDRFFAPVLQRSKSSERDCKKIQVSSPNLRRQLSLRRYTCA